MPQTPLILTTKQNIDASLLLQLLNPKLNLYFSVTYFIFLPSSLSSFLFLSPLLPSLIPLSVVWSNNLLIIGCKKYLLRDYARYKELTGDGSRNLSASLMRPEDCKACSAETEHPLLALHGSLTQLSDRELGPAQLSSAQFCSA